MRFLLGILAAAVAAMAWGAVWWTVLPVQDRVMAGTAEEPALVEAMARAFPRTGVYFIPWLAAGAHDEAAWEDVMARQAEGPVAQVFYRAEGVPASAAPFLLGFVQFALVAALLGLLLKAAPQPTYGRRWGLAVAVGLAAVVATDLGHPIWFHHPWGWWLVTAFFNLATFTVMGAVLAAFVKPRARAP